MSLQSRRLGRGISLVTHLRESTDNKQLGDLSLCRAETYH